LLRSPFATRGRSYPQQGASGRAEQSQVVMTLEALKVAIHACRYRLDPHPARGIWGSNGLPDFTTP
ncbi:hypothetical protein, partial [Pseudomonas putida]|uniref:hypothetical protein n=1 Tax=Pseudomonas putida TaxID=303 RepID=UPI002B242A4D